MKRTWALVLLLTGLMLPAQGMTEPWFAVQTGMKCANCHVNPAGGGMRNTYGNLWAQNELPANRIETRHDPWTGLLNNYVALGGNLRANANYTDVPDQDAELGFEHQESRLFLHLSPVPDRLSFYLDQRVAPGGSQNREAYGRYRFDQEDWYVSVGQMYLPYGLRLEDDTAFIRQTPGINMTTPDQAILLGWEPSNWSLQAAVSEGAEALTGKQFSLRAEHVRSRWRAGGSLNLNDTDDGSRQMQNVFGGLQTGPVFWLAELNHIRDGSLPGDPLTQWAALLEANWLIRQGHNFKLTLEYLDPDGDLNDNEQNRYSLVWEYAPVQFMQLRLGTRFYDGPDEIDFQNRTRMFLQFHSFF